MKWYTISNYVDTDSGKKIYTVKIRTSKIQQMKWYTISNYVDTDTGEKITKEQIKNKEYRIINKTKKIEHDNYTTGTITITNLCRKNQYQQAKLQLE